MTMALANADVWRESLTDRQAEVLAYLRRYIRDYARPPAYTEIAKAIGVASKRAVSDHLRALERKGAIVLEGATRGTRTGRSRTLRLVVPKGCCQACGQPLPGAES
jgi:repressor LexA